MSKQYKYTKYFTFDGKRYVVRADTMEELYTKKANKIRDLEEGKVTISGNTTLAEWTQICIETYKPNMSDKSKQDMIYRLNKHLLNSIGNMPLKKITPLQCQKIMSAQSGMSKSHVDKLRQSMVFIFETARKNHLILDNPAEDMIMPKVTEGERRSITDNEREHLLKVADQYDPFVLFLMILYCGCRPSEARNAIGSDITMINDIPMLHIRGTKTANSDRYVPIPLHFYPRIEKTDPDAPIAPNTVGKRHCDSTYRHLVNRLYREMNISMGCKMYRNRLVPPYPLAEDFVPYCLRHTYCTDLAKMGVDVRVAQKLMGHSSIEITADIYTHVDTSSLISAANIINQGVAVGVAP